MPLNRDSDDAPLSPAWTAAAAAVASLLGLWPCQLLYQELWVREHGAGGFILAVYAPIAFFVVFPIGFYLLRWLLRRRPSPQARWALCVVPAALLLAMNGVPGLFGLGWTLVMTVSVFVEARRKSVDDQDLKIFLKGEKPIVNLPFVDSSFIESPLGRQLTGSKPLADQPLGDKPRQVPVTTSALRAYEMPLWARLELEFLQALSTTEGLEDGFHYTVLDLRHRGLGLKGDNGATVVTTFFIVTIPEAVKGRVVTWQPDGWEVSVDADRVYLAQVQKQVRPGEWRSQIQQAIKVAESLKTREEAGRQAHAPTYRPRGSGVVANLFHAGLFLVVGVLLVGFGLATMVGLVDYRTHCLRGATTARCLDTRHGYSVPGALIDGGKFVLAGAFLLWGAHHARTQARRRQRNDAHQQADL